MSLESLRYGAPAADVVRFVHCDGAVILRDVLNAEQLTEINAELDRLHWVLRRFSTALPSAHRPAVRC